MRACLVLWCSGQKSIFWIQTFFGCGEGGMGPASVARAAKSHACLVFWESSARYMRPFEIPSFLMRTIVAPYWESFTSISPYIALIGIFAFQFLAPKEKSKEALLLQLQQLQEQVGRVWWMLVKFLLKFDWQRLKGIFQPESSFTWIAWHAKCKVHCHHWGEFHCRVTLAANSPTWSKPDQNSIFKKQADDLCPKDIDHLYPRITVHRLVYMAKW